MTMTPMEQARTSLTLSMGRHGDIDKALEAAILAYLQAVAKDEETVEAVARAIYDEANEYTSYVGDYKFPKGSGADTCLDGDFNLSRFAIAALTSLASRVKA